MKHSAKPLFVRATVPTFLIAAVCAIGCGGQTAEAQTPESATTPLESTGDSPATPEAAPEGESATVEVPDSWTPEMTKDQKVAFMKQRVVPPMSAVFQEHDAEGFADFGCETCHGSEYKAPKDVLAVLTMKDGKLTSFEEEPEISQFMASKVVPAMARAFGMEPYNPETHQGFGCGGCHAIEMQ